MSEIDSLPYHDTALALHSAKDGPQLHGHDSKPDGQKEASCRLTYNNSDEYKCERPQERKKRGWANADKSGQVGREGEFWLIICEPPLWMIHN